MPERWEAATIGDLLVFKNGLNKSRSFFGHGTPIVNFLDVLSNAGLHASDIKGLVEVSPQEAQRFSARLGDVFFTRTSESVEEIGLSSVLLDVIDNAVFSGFVLRGRPKNDRVEHEFKKYCFRSPAVRQQIVSRASYTTRALTNGRALSNVALVLPPKDEQKAISRALSDADALLQGLQQLTLKKRDIRRGAIYDLLTAGTRLPGFSDPWREVRLGDHVSFLKTLPIARADLSPDGPVKYLHYGDIHASSRFRLDARRESMPRTEQIRDSRRDYLRAGDLVFVDVSEDMGGLGKALEISDVPDDGAVAGLHTIAARFDKKVLADGFKAYLQFHPHLRSSLLRLAAGTKVLATSKAHIADVTLQLPTVPEQSAIARLLGDLDAEIDALDLQVEKVRNIREGMMQQLLSGQARLATEAAAR